jgi:hypothetical protein
LLGTDAKRIGRVEVEVAGRPAVDARYLFTGPDGETAEARVLRIDGSEWVRVIAFVDRRPPDETTSKEIEAVLASLEIRKPRPRQGALTALRPNPVQGGWKARMKALKEDLKAIRLPEKAGREEAREYVLRILRLMQATNVREEGLFEGRLAEVGPGHVGLLLDLRHSPEGAAAWEEIETVVRRLVGDGQRDAILARLERDRSLVHIVIEKGWTEAARLILVRSVLRGVPRLPEAWLAAVAGFRDPETYEGLLLAFIRAERSSEVHDALREIPGLDLGVAVDLLWRRAREATSWPNRSPRYVAWRRGHAARVAARHGHVDALEVLIAAVAAGPKKPVTHQEGLEAELRKLLGYEGSKADLSRWFEEREDRLVFDAAAGRYGVR